MVASVMLVGGRGDGLSHRVDRVLSFFSSRLNWTPPLPHTQASVYPPPLWLRGAHSLGGEEMGGGGSQFGRGNRHCGALGIYVVRPLTDDPPNC
jgi:hypothetical protein